MKCLTTAALLACSMGASAQTAGQEQLEKKLTLQDFLINNAAQSVSAAQLAGVGGDAVQAVQNVRDLALVFKGGGQGDNTYGLSFTPARSQFRPLAMSLDTYAHGGLLQRLWGSTTFSYAQGQLEAGGRNFNRRAYSVEATMPFPGDDPVLLLRGVCVGKALDSKAPPTGPVPQPQGEAPVQPVPMGPVSEPRLAEMTNAFNACRAEILEAITSKWNKSAFSASAAGGSVNAADGAGHRHSLGTTLALNVTWGPDVNLDDVFGKDARMAVSASLRRARREPVLTTLADPSPQFADSTVKAIRLEAGSATFRGLVEFSSSSSAAPTANTSVYKRAIGANWLVSKNVWLQLRSGKQRKLTGDGEQTVSMMTLNFGSGDF